jgi:toxin YoeB
MRAISFEGNTWERYEDLRTRDKRLFQTLHQLLKEMQRSDPTQGRGQPEALRYNLSGYWSRHLSTKDRLIYRFDDERIYIFAIGGHYEDK